MILHAGAADVGDRLLLGSDGAKGRGEIDLMRKDDGVSIIGTTLSGAHLESQASIAQADLLGAGDFLAGKVLLARHLVTLAVGKSISLRSHDVTLGSSARVTETSIEVMRVADETIVSKGKPVAARVYELHRQSGGSPRLWLDEQGWPLAYELPSFGAVVRFERIDDQGHAGVSMIVVPSVAK
jgi:hypothetical protein